MLADLGGATVLERLVKRVSKAKRPEVVVLATTQEPEDDELTSAAEALGISVFRGSTHDVLVRWRDAAAAYGADLLVNCDGDDVFCDPPHIDRIIETYEQTGAEYIVCAGLPFGAAPTGIAASGLERVCERKLEDNTEGQGRFFAVPGIVSKAEVAAPAELGHATARMTLDYPEDLDFFSAVVSELPGRATNPRRSSRSSRCSAPGPTSSRSTQGCRSATGSASMRSTNLCSSTERMTIRRAR